MKTPGKFHYLVIVALLISFPVCMAQEGFPYTLPEEKPDRELSLSVERNYDAYMAPRPEDNELFTEFKYTELKGFDYNNYDGTITRRDPTKVIFTNGKYYVWYTHRHTATPPQKNNFNDTIPYRDVDLCEIWYATSEDGFTWDEQGVAITRPPKPLPGCGSVLTPDILKWEGKYYLYYQAFPEAPWHEKKCPVAVSWADSPDGPWTATNKIVIPNGDEGEWDQLSIHDPYPLVYKGKIYLYYKSDFDTKERRVRMQGLAIADDPLGPFEKHRLNPIMGSGHTTTMFHFKKGIAAILTLDGNERYTIQYAEDGVNFKIASIVSLMPRAAGPFVPDAFTNTKYGRGITWGLSHVRPELKSQCVILMRFDCDLSLDVNDPMMKKHANYYDADFFYQYSLDEEQLERIANENKKLHQEK